MYKQTHKNTFNVILILGISNVLFILEVLKPTMPIYVAGQSVMSYVSIESQSKALGNAQPLPHERDYPRGRVLILSSQSSSISPRSSSVCPSGCFIVQVEANERRREKSPLVSKMLVKHLKVFPTRWSTKSLSDLVKQSVKPSTALPHWALSVYTQVKMS